MGLVHDLIDFVAGDEFPGAVSAVMDEAIADSVGDALRDLGTGWAVEVDQWQAVMGAGKRWELIANGLNGYRWEIHTVGIVAEECFKFRGRR